MIVAEVIDIGENFRATWGRGPKGTMVRRYRCTSGPKRGRVVAKASTCSTPVSGKKSITAKKTRRTRARSQSIRRYHTVRRPTANKITRLNKVRPKYRRGLKTKRRR